MYAYLRYSLCAFAGGTGHLHDGLQVANVSNASFWYMSLFTGQQSGVRIADVSDCPKLVTRKIRQIHRHLYWPSYKLSQLFVNLTLEEDGLEQQLQGVIVSNDLLVQFTGVRNAVDRFTFRAWWLFCGLNFVSLTAHASCSCSLPCSNLRLGGLLKAP